MEFMKKSRAVGVSLVFKEKKVGPPELTWTRSRNALFDSILPWRVDR